MKTNLLNKTVNQNLGNFDNLNLYDSIKNVLNKDELKQIKGGITGGEEDEGDVYAIMDWVK